MMTPGSNFTLFLQAQRAWKEVARGEARLCVRHPWIEPPNAVHAKGVRVLWIARRGSRRWSPRTGTLLACAVESNRERSLR
jgi:hypothetical protein